MNTQKFFRKSDWIACLVTFSISLFVYTLTLQPTVSLEDSGELVVASDYLGVPHPPGYPIWTLLTWFFQWIFHGVTYNGQPNPAWAVNFFSAFAGAAACGIIALLISRSGKDLLASLKKESSILGEKTEILFCAAAGISSGLLLAFGPGMWSQAVIAEVYTLNIFFQSLVLLFLYRWICEKDQPIWLWLCAFTFGLGITNHQTLMFMGLGIAMAVLCQDLDIFKRKHIGFVFGALIALVLAGFGFYFNNLALLIIGILATIIACMLISHPFLVRDFVVTGCMYILMVGFNKWAVEAGGHPAWAWTGGPEHAGFWIWTLYSILVPLLAIFILPRGKVVGPTFLVMLIGLSFYLYMPFSSDQNPPINWGYPRTWEGFMHAITRGQYERVKLAAVFTPQFLQQIGTYLMDLRSQFYWPIALLAAVPFAFCWKVGKRNIGWLVTTLISFLSVGIVFMILQNPKTDIQNLFIGRVQYIQSHAIYVLWLGYGILFLMAFLESLVKNNPVTKLGGTVLVLLLPFALIYKNYTDPHQLKVVGGAEQNGHDFGWQFGNWQLRGVEGIKADLQAWHSEKEFERIWAEYPNPEYPPAMGTNAIFFGGTDPGRFVPTYMIYSAKVRPDVYLITQNALADNTYMAVMRDLYGDQIWIPTQIENNMAFQKYVQGVKNGTIDAGADVITKDGRVQVQGVAGVMKINGFLSEWIFQHNQYRTEPKTDETTRPVGSAVVPMNPEIDPATGTPPSRDFYVEESYVMPWMYPYLTPHGLILKLNNKPTKITPEHIKNDTEFWAWYSNRLLNDQRFIRDIVARKSFAKLRSALAGLYAARGFPKEAEAAFLQSIALYPLNPESNFRLANMYAQQGRITEAQNLLAKLIEQDPKNDSANGFLKQLSEASEMNKQRTALEQKLQSGKIAFNEANELMILYIRMGQLEQAKQLALMLVESPGIQPAMLLHIAQGMTHIQKLDATVKALVKYTELAPQDPSGWINLAAVYLVQNQQQKMLEAVKNAVDHGGEAVRSAIRKDPRFNAARQIPAFQRLVPSLPQVSPSNGFPL